MPVTSWRGSDFEIFLGVGFFFFCNCLLPFFFIFYFFEFGFDVLFFLNFLFNKSSILNVN